MDGSSRVLRVFSGGDFSIAADRSRLRQQRGLYCGAPLILYGGYQTICRCQRNQPNGLGACGHTNIMAPEPYWFLMPYLFSFMIGTAWSMG